jgi:hypothetical protein
LKNFPKKEQERTILSGINRLKTKEVWDNIPKETQNNFIKIAEEAKENIKKREKENGNEN